MVENITPISLAVIHAPFSQDHSFTLRCPQAMEKPLATLDAIATLEHQIQQLEAEGTAPNGAWIECGRVKGRKFRQAWWRSEQAIFTSSRGRGLVKSQYIGEEGSTKHQAAIAARSRREELRQLQTQVGMLQREMGGS